MPSDKEHAGDRTHSFSFPPWRRQAGIGAAIAAAAYGLALVVTLPAASIIHLAPPVTLSGTLWHGRASLPGNSALVWTADPLRSLAGFSFVADWTLRGPDADLSGRARLGPHSIALERVSGQTGAGLVMAFFPGLALRCQGMARVDLRHISLNRKAIEADGEVRSTAAVCAQPGSEPRSIPPLLASVSSSAGQLRARMSAQATPETGLATVDLGPDGKLIAELRPEAGAVLPGLPQLGAGAGPFRLETTLSMP